MKIRPRINKTHIPSIFTLMNLFLGFLAIISIVGEQYHRAVYLIIVAAIFDGLDGKLARWIHAPSKLGSELDSLADLVSFCLTPSLLIWSVYASDLHPVVGGLIAGTPLYFGAWRLARYNAALDEGPSSHFEGLPVPIAALTVAALVMYYGPQNLAAAKVVLPSVLAISFLMVSQVRYRKTPHLSLKAGLGNSAFLIGILMGGVAFLVFGMKVMLPMLTLYIVAGIVRWLARAGVDEEFESVEEEI